MKILDARLETFTVLKSHIVVFWVLTTSLYSVITQKATIKKKLDVHWSDA